MEHEGVDVLMIARIFRTVTVAFRYFGYEYRTCSLSRMDRVSKVWLGGVCVPWVNSRASSPLARILAAINPYSGKGKEELMAGLSFSRQLPSAGEAAANVAPRQRRHPSIHPTAAVAGYRRTVAQWMTRCGR